MPTPEPDLDAIEMRATLATPGPWHPWDRGVGWHIATTLPEGDRTPPLIPEGIRTDIGRREDAQFVAAARTDVPDLVTEARQLRARVAELERELLAARRAAFDEHEKTRAAGRAAEAQVRAVREAVDWLGGILATSARDWGASQDLALVYGVILGWDDPDDDGALREIAALFPPGSGFVARMQEHRATVRALDAAGAPARPPRTLLDHDGAATGVASSAPAVTDAMVTAAWETWYRLGRTARPGYDRMRAALTAALAAGQDSGRRQD